MFRLLQFSGLMIRQQLRDATDIRLVDQAAASGARMTLALGVLVTEVMAAARRIGFESLRRLAETLGRRPVGFQLGHFNLHLYSYGSQGGPMPPACLRTRSPAPCETTPSRRSLLFW